MDLRQLRLFVAVAEELHFSRAAERMNLAQSALSAQIRGLERELGGPLFLRTSRRVTLTPAGVALLGDARTLLTSAEHVRNRAQALARGDAGQLMIGSLGPASGGLLAPVLASIGSRRPDVRLQLRALRFSEMISAVVEGGVDVALVYLPVEEPGIEVTPLLEEPRVVALAASHPLAGRAELTPTDLSGERFVAHPAAVSRRWQDFWRCADELGAGPPSSGHSADTLEEWLHLIERGEGIDTCPARVSRYYSWPGVSFVPLSGAPPARLALARRAGDGNPLTAEFRRVALDQAGRSSATGA